jgi:uncharacterized protein with PQ loop repeat
MANGSMATRHIVANKTLHQVPQLIENYRQGSAEGISITFLVVWFIGDITNLIGAVWAGLVPTVIALAIYFCFADLILISQCVYYNALNARRDRKLSQMTAESSDSAEQPLLQRSSSFANSRRRRSSLGLPGSQRRRSSQASRRRSSLAAIVEEESGSKAWFKNAVSIFLVCAAGTAGWAIAWKSNVWHPAPEESADPSKGVHHTALGAEILGYISAVCYLGARIPQIIKNQRDRSCEGLSLLFFLLSLLGNFTYGAGVGLTAGFVICHHTDVSLRSCSIRSKRTTCSPTCRGWWEAWARWRKMQSSSCSSGCSQLAQVLRALSSRPWSFMAFVRVCT